MKICVNVPSIRPDKCLRLIDSFYNNMSPWTFDVFHFHVIHQGWTIDDIATLSDIISQTSYELKPRPSMMTLRMASVYKFGMLPDYYMFMDDDQQFTKAFSEYFDDVIYRLRYSKPAVLQLFKNRYGPDPQYDPEECIMTINRGLFVNSMYITGMPYEYTIKEGGGEDALIGYWALSNYNNRIIMGGAPIENEGVKHFSKNSESFIHDSDVFDNNNGRLIRQLFNDPTWTLLSGKLPRGIK